MNSEYINQSVSSDGVLKAQIQQQTTHQLWKLNDQKAQKNTPHSAIYWVKRQNKNEDGSQKNQKWVADQKYVGDWKDNRKSGFGVQYNGNGDKYEGGWEDNKKNGQGTYWVYEGKNKMRREYTGDWVNDKKTGRGTMFYENGMSVQIQGNRYDGLWQDDKPHGEGRMIYANGDVYEGQWFKGARSGYGVVTKRNGDHFEGFWVNDKREGQGSYFYSSKNQVFVGEWVDDMPKTGVYSEVEDPVARKEEREKHFMDGYILPDFPKVELTDPSLVLKDSMEQVKRQRTIYRAKHIPVDGLYSKDQLDELAREFAAASLNDNHITLVNIEAILASMGFNIDEKQLESYLRELQQEFNGQEIDLESFMRLVAIVLEVQSWEESQL